MEKNFQINALMTDYYVTQIDYKKTKKNANKEFIYISFFCFAIIFASSSSPSFAIYAGSP